MVFRWLQSKNQKNSGMVFLIFLIGIVCLLIGGGTKEVMPQAESEEVEPTLQLLESAQTTYEMEIEKRLADILSQVDGAGRVDVMVTYKSTEEKILAVDSYVEKSGSNELGKEVTSKEEVITVMVEEENRSTKPYVIAEKMPTVEGVIVVADGGDQSVVQQNLHNAVQAVLGVDAHKITILKMK